MQFLSYIMKCQISIQMNTKNAKIKQMEPIYDPVNVTIDAYDYKIWLKKDEESADVPSTPYLKNFKKK